MNLILSAVILAAAAAQQDPVTALQKRVEETSRKVNTAFVFFAGGSGVIISEDGWLLTNHHVIGGARTMPKSVEVRLQDAKKRVAELICTDPVGDIALLKMEPEEGTKFSFVPFADSDKAEIGQYVLAIGAPLGFGAHFDPAPDGRHYPSVSLGIVSALHRFQQQYGDCIQTDAAVNPGNSGGPLVDLDGRLLGINGRILTRYFNRVNSGVGFAIPSNQIANFLPKMKAGGIGRKIYHGQVMGLTLRDRNPDGEGAIVGGVRDRTAAANAGFKEGDVIVAVDGKRVFSPWRFQGLISTWPADSEVTVTVRRGDKTEKLKVTLESGTSRDITGEILDPRAERGGSSGATFNDEKDGTVTVTFVKPFSAADEAGLAAGDIVLKVDGAEVKSRKTILDRVHGKKPGDTLVLTVRREGEEREIEITLEKPKGD
jgi:serine protease Do